MGPRATVTAIDVNHGDATLIEWRDGRRRWSCLVDGGQHGKPVIAQLVERGVKRLDLMVATHLDSDHISGLIEIAQQLEVVSYWGPALPAFARHRWLFGKRCQDSIARGERLEEVLRQRGVPICYPLEGYATGESSLPRVHVLSPAARLIGHLLTTDDAQALFAQSMPLGWLLRDDDDDDDDDDDELQLQQPNLRRQLTRGFLEPVDLERTATSTGSRRKADSLATRWARVSATDPEFFGDPILNNTSLVLWVELPTGARWHRLLLPGDQENWTYLYARHQRGLQADLLKASHHGGRVYLENDLSHEELLRWIRPRAVLVSANGQHSLPRLTTREAAIRYGATVFCTSRRGKEILLDAASGRPTEVCCHTQFECKSQERASVTIELDADGMRAHQAACHSGYGSYDAPVIELRQHVIDPSPVINQLFGEELRRHVRWIAKYLADVHSTRLKGAIGTSRPADNTAVGEEQLEHAARSNDRDALIPHLRTVLRAARDAGAIWAKGYKTSAREEKWLAYRVPTKTEIRQLISAIDKLGLIMFEEFIPEAIVDPASVLASVSPASIADLASTTLLMPDITFRELFWPDVASHLATWRGYRHQSGVVAVARKLSVDGLTEHLLQLAHVDKEGVWEDSDAIKAAHSKTILLPKETRDPNRSRISGGWFSRRTESILTRNWWTTYEDNALGVPSQIENRHMTGKFGVRRDRLASQIARCIRQIW